MTASLWLPLVLATSLFLPSGQAAASDSQETSAATAVPPSPPPPPPSPEALLSDPDMAVQAPPIYPDDEQCRHIDGTITLRLNYDRTGRVTDVRVVSGTGSFDLDHAAISAAWSWRLNPGTRDGLPVAGEAVVPVSFVDEPGPDPRCDSPVRLQAVKFGRQGADGSAPRGIRPRLVSNEVAVLEITYLALERRPKSSLSVRWSRFDATGEPILSTTAPPLESGRHSALFRLSVPGGLEPGLYKVQVFVDGERRLSLTFSVSAYRPAGQGPEAAAADSPDGR